MSFFDDDDFYRARKSSGSRGLFRGHISGRWRSGNPIVRVAVLSSLVTTVAVLLLVVLISRWGSQEALPAAASGQPLDTSERIIRASELVKPAVVSVINLTNMAVGMMDEDELANEDAVLEYANLGSGVIFRVEAGKAYIITNAHVVQDAYEVQIVLLDGTKKAAEIVGTDIITDLAVLKVNGVGVQSTIQIGSSDKLRDGEMVIASGNPLGFGDSLTQGIVSNRKRVIPVSLNQNGIYDWEQEVIQIDAAINHGNSGGALVDLQGRLVGINSMKVADYGVEGIGFAIPIDAAMPVIEELLAKGKLQRPYMGVYTVDLSVYLSNRKASEAWDDEEYEDGDWEEWEDSESSDSGSEESGKSGGSAGGATEESGPILLEVPAHLKTGIVVLEASGPAKKAGLKYNDIIVALDGKAIKNMLEMRRYLYNIKKIGESLEITYYRAGKQGKLTMQLEEKRED